MGLLSNFAYTQVVAQDKNLVQFSGLTLDGSTEKLLPVPYTAVAIKGTHRGTYSDWKGFFSIVAQKGDVVVFSALGYKTVEFVIPDTLKDARYSLVQMMTQDAINLPETIVFPWPSRDHFKQEFLAMKPSNEAIKQSAEENVAEKTLAAIREITPMDGNENADYYLRQQAQNYYFYGQSRPMNIFNVFAWKQFFDAWKSGKYKKKKER